MKIPLLYNDRNWLNKPRISFLTSDLRSLMKKGGDFHLENKCADLSESWVVALKY